MAGNRDVSGVYTRNLTVGGKRGAPSAGDTNSKSIDVFYVFN